MNMFGRYRETMPRIGALLLVLALVVGFAPQSQAQVENEPTFFPQTGHSLRGVFRNFWQANGAVGVFGYPITEEYVPAVGAPLTQYFERARFELVEQNGQYSVRLGKLGAEYLAGHVFPKAQPIQNTAQRRYIPETGYIIQYGFKEIWETWGGPGLFGWPLSNELQEVTNDGQLRTVQYFENFRFEFWPERQPGQRVEFTLLGRALAPAERQVPIGEEQARSPQLESQQPAHPPNKNARMIPEAGPPGTIFIFEANGLKDGEDLMFWLTRPDQTTQELDYEAKADANGNIYGRISVDSTGFMGGVWAITVQGDESGEEGNAYAYFTIDGNLPPQPTPEPPPATRATGKCSENAPAPADGLIAWMTDDDPELDTTTRICVQFIRDGKGVQGADVRAEIQYDNDDDDVGPELTNINGVAELKFKVTDDEDEVDERADVEITVTYQGERMTTDTNFIPRD